MASAIRSGLSSRFFCLSFACVFLCVGQAVAQDDDLAVEIGEDAANSAFFSEEVGNVGGGVTDTRESSPVVEPLGGASIFITRTRSEPRRTVLDDADMHTQIAKYGRLYRQVSVSSDDGDWLTGEGEPGQTGLRQIDCSKNSNNKIAKFLGAIFGVKKNRASVLTLSISAPGTATGEADRALITDYPILAMNREGVNKCSYKLNTADLTPYINIHAGERMKLSVKVRHTKNTRVDFQPLLGAITDIATFTSANATDGVVAGATEIASSGLNDKINSFMAYFDTGLELGREIMLPLGDDPTYSHDKVVISFGRPTNDGGYDTISFRSAPAISIGLGYRPTRFADCNARIRVGDCSGTFDELRDILEKKTSGGTLDTVLKTDPNPDNAESESLFKQIRKAEDAASDVDRSAALAAVCAATKDPRRFKAQRALNKLDRLIARYAFLSTYSSYMTNAALKSEACFDRFEMQSLVDLGPAANPDFTFPVNLSGTVTERANKVNLMLRNQISPNAKAALFGQQGVLDIRIPALLEAEGGAAIRPEGAAGPSAGEALKDLIFTLGAACAQHGADAISGENTDKKFGFIQRARDTAAGARMTAPTYLPIVIQLSPSASDDNLTVSSLTIAGSLHEYGSLLNSSLAESQLRTCAATLTTPGEKAAWDSMLALFGEGQ